MAEFKDMMQYYRKVNGMTQRELADKIGISHSAVGMYESGKRFPTKEIEEALADIFNVSLDNLRGIDSEKLSQAQGEGDARLLVMYHRLSPSNKEVLMATLQALLTSQDKS